MKALLDPLLTKLSQEAMQMAEGEEAKGDLGQAIERFELAETGFGKAVGMNPGNTPAQTGLQGDHPGGSCQTALGNGLPRRTDGPARNNTGRNQRSFQPMLSRVKAEDDQSREMNARHTRPHAYNEERDRNLRNW